MNDWIKIHVTRDSVCTADDCDSPHEVVYKIYPDIKISELARKIHNDGYLPSIQGGKATWFMYIQSEPICLMTQENFEIRFLPNKDCALEDKEENGTLNIKIKYFAQENPDLVYSNLLKGIKPNGWNKFV